MNDSDLMELKKKARLVCRRLLKAYPVAECELDFRNPFEVLIATVLSAQCTDRKVNMVTPELFKRFPAPADLAEAKLADVEDIIRSLGLYRNKAKNIIAAARSIQHDFAGELPDNMDDLVSLAGVGRKTANCVLVNAFNKPGIMVDTHCKRLSGRIGLTVNSNPDKIEHDLKIILAEKDWNDFSHRIILHGRRVCTARCPQCAVCTLRAVCDYYNIRKRQVGNG